MATQLLNAKLKAAALHGLVSAIVAVIATLLVFNIWFPGPLADLMEGKGMLKLVVLVEICLGPLISLVIFNPAKPSSELFRDYTVIGTIQLAALVYGLYVISISRPVYLVFVKDRVEVVSALEISKDDLDDASLEFSRLPLMGPKFICVESPTDPIEKSDLLISALEGRDIQLIPKYYRECHENEVTEKAFAFSDFDSFAEHVADLEGIEKQKLEQMAWLPLVSRFETWTMIFSKGSFEPHDFSATDPFEFISDLN